MKCVAVEEDQQWIANLEVEGELGFPHQGGFNKTLATTLVFLDEPTKFQIITSQTNPDE